MKHEDFENQMFDCVKRNCKMKELDRQEIARVAQEEYRMIRKCKKINATIGIVLCFACFGTFTFAMSTLSWLGNIHDAVAVAGSSMFGLVCGLSINSLVNKIKK